MTKAFDELKKLLKERQKEDKELKPEDIEKAEKEHGKLTDEEKVELAADAHKKKKEKREGDKVTLDQYLEATKVMDKAKEDSDEYKKAKKIVDAFESAA